MKLDCKKKKEEKNLNKKETKGITLIALVITIIVLLILAGVSIAMLTGQNGILNQANKAKIETEEARKQEQKNLEMIEDQFLWTGTVNKPKITSDMIPVYWNESNEEIKKGDSNYKQEEWYNYVAGDNNTDSKNSKWANAKTQDGSYWVWIPRYEYKITSGEGTSTAGKIEVKFIPTNQTKADEGYKIHPAFTDGSNSKFSNGEWDKELAGIWIAKYEISGENEKEENIQPGNINQLSETVKLVSKPNVSSWRNITTGNCYTVSYNYDRKKESHMMKNSEWGAVAYLTHSQYGRNGNEIGINSNSGFITQAGGENSSTTGNKYGIYDLSGGAFEYVTGYIVNGNPSLKTYGESYTYNSEGNLIIESTKYATVYPYDISSDNRINNYNVYRQSENKRYGEAILETSTSGEGTTSWFGDYSHFPNTSGTFFSRGGYFGNGVTAGSFYFYSRYGDANSNYSFRVCLAF